MMAYAKIKGMTILFRMCSEESKQFCDILDRKNGFYIEVM
jgi:hypothetical protein